MKGLGIVLIAVLLGGGAAPAEVVRDDASVDNVPAGMVSFFTTTSCPTGWKVADPAAGRLVVATADPTAIGRVIGAALGDSEDRAHGHTITTATIDLPAKSISAADGGNDSGGASGTRTLAATAAPATSGLPFVQLTACVRSLP